MHLFETFKSAGFWQLSEVPDTKWKNVSELFGNWLYAKIVLTLNELERRIELTTPFLSYWRELCISCLILKCLYCINFTYLSLALVLIVWSVDEKEHEIKKNKKTKPPCSVPTSSEKLGVHRHCQCFHQKRKMKILG